MMALKGPKERSVMEKRWLDQMQDLQDRLVALRDSL